MNKIDKLNKKIDAAEKIMSSEEYKEFLDEIIFGIKYIRERPGMSVEEIYEAYIASKAVTDDV